MASRDSSLGHRKRLRERFLKGDWLAFMTMRLLNFC